MILCHVCRQPVAGGWVTGFPPAPDSQKMGLCAQHDTPENRQMVEAAWQHFFSDSVTDAVRLQTGKHQGRTYEVTIVFKAGGVVRHLCTACESTDHNSLRVTTLAGENVFFPLQDIKEYIVRPVQDPSQDIFYK